MIGDLILIDEMLAISLPIAMLVFGWWADYPIDRRLREATLIGSIDAGRPIQAIWTRSQYLLGQVRHQLALMLVPLLVLIGWLEMVITWAPRDELVQAGLSLGGAGILFLFAPLVIRRIWDTIPLPPGELRQMLVDMCRQHRVVVRELLLWRTFGGLLNAAVMGVVGPLRYILMTDALLESLPLKQVEAVMAHEIAHVRRHHMFWLLIVAAGASTLLQTLGAIIFDLLIPTSSVVDPQPVAAGFTWELLNDPELAIGVIACCGAACWLLTFGWVSRRFERQADTFAVQHLVQQRTTTDDPSNPSAPRIVDAQAVGTMVLALEQVSCFNHMATTRRSWRHGSIAWRQAYLNALIGLDAKRLPIDRQIFWIKCAGATVLTATIALSAIFHT
jgi:STE24 endopeptidase